MYLVASVRLSVDTLTAEPFDLAKEGLSEKLKAN